VLLIVLRTLMCGELVVNGLPVSILLDMLLFVTAGL
jgi:hypothetical protein